MGNDFKGIKGVDYAGAGTIEALVKIILNGEEVRLTGTFEDGQVLMRVLDGAVHYWTNRTPGFIVGPDISDKVDKIPGKGLSTEDFTTVLKALLNAQSGTNTGDETQATILTKLGKTALYSQEETDLLLNDKVDAVAGSRLITEDEAKLLDGTVTVKRLTLPASDEVSGRITGATLDTGITSIAAVDGTDLLITHTLTGRKIVAINVFSTDTGVDRWLPSGSIGYAGFTGDATTVTIEGLTNIDLPLRIELIFS